MHDVSVTVVRTLKHNYDVSRNSSINSILKTTINNKF